jgi:REP element-mobilizing transposase RayT
LQDYDYSQAGAYFVTICANNRQCLFGDVVDGEMVLNDAGRMVETVWMELAIRFGYIELDEFTIMPNHFHGIFILSGRGESCIRPEMGDHKDRPYDTLPGMVIPVESGDHKDRPYGTLPGTVGRVIQAFKSTSTHEYINGVKQNNWTPFAGKLWQRNYYEHVIRNEESLNRIREYIINNPLQWAYDRENPAGATHASSLQKDEPWRI